MKNPVKLLVLLLFGILSFTNFIIIDVVATVEEAIIDITDVKTTTSTKTKVTTAATTKATTTKPKTKNKKLKPIPIGSLRPQDLPEPLVFTKWEPTINQTFTIPIRQQQQSLSSSDSDTQSESTEQSPLLYYNFTYATGSVPRPHTSRTNPKGGGNSISTQQQGTIPPDLSFSVIESLVSRAEVDEVLQILKSYDKLLDDDPDTVDSMPSYEIFVDTPWVANPDPQTPKYREISDHNDRKELRAKLQSILVPIIQQRILPFLHHRFPTLCNATRYCLPCYSLIRRYRYGERVSHPPHNDGHALLTAVTSLSDYDANYRGGLYVVAPDSVGTTNITDKSTTGLHHPPRDEIPNNFRYLGLNKGDTVVHTSALLHGVKVYPKKKNRETTERWSWILWFHDSYTSNDTAECSSTDHSKEWFEECAANGDTICEQIYSTKVSTVEDKYYWTHKAALGGASLSAVKIARAYLLQYHLGLSFDPQKAMEYYQLAISSSNDPEAHYGIAELVLKSLVAEEKEAHAIQRELPVQYKLTGLKKAIYHLEAAAMSGHVLAMFNLGVVHTFGYGGTINDKGVNEMMDTALACDWFVQSGLPEGYFVASQYAASIGDTVRQEQYFKTATILGYGTAWRQTMRQQTGSGVIGNVNLNLDWPTSHDGRVPPQL